MRFIIALGIVSLFADVTYEGARGVIGPFFASLGASGAVVGMVAGAGELTGYTLRYASGRLADRTRAYWTITILGYIVNLFAVPLLALAGRWEVAAMLVIAERTGKSIRGPARDVMLSHAAHRVGRGWGFGLHAALDQVGAIIGPLLVAGMVAWRKTYSAAFFTLAIPAGMALAALAVARFQYPHPHEMESVSRTPGAKDLPREFRLYIAAAGLLAMGFVDFPLIAYHFEKASIVAPEWIPGLYSVAMAVNALTALAYGRLYDRFGIVVLPGATLFSMLALPFAFFGGLASAVAAMVAWGSGMGAQDAILRAGVAGLVPPDQRGSAYGAFNAVYGVLWFAGSATMGVLYGHSFLLLVAFGMAAQLASAGLFLRFRRITSGRPGAPATLPR